MDINLGIAWIFVVVSKLGLEAQVANMRCAILSSRERATAFSGAFFKVSVVVLNARAKRFHSGGKLASAHHEVATTGVDDANRLASMAAAAFRGRCVGTAYQRPVKITNE